MSLKVLTTGLLRSIRIKAIKYCDEVWLGLKVLSFPEMVASIISVFRNMTVPTMQASHSCEIVKLIHS